MTNVLNLDTPLHLEDQSPPLRAGWLVSGYWGSGGRLAGGADDRERGEVKNCEWVAATKSFTVILVDGQQLRLCQVRSVGQTNKAGEIISAWTTEQHGIDGKGKR